MSASLPVRLTVNLGAADRIPLGEGRQFQINDTTIAVFRSRSGAVFATQGACPHKGGPLADGVVGHKTIVCPVHAFGYDLRSGQPAGHNCGILKTYSAELNRKGEIVIVVQ